MWHTINFCLPGLVWFGLPLTRSHVAQLHYITPSFVNEGSNVLGSNFSRPGMLPDSSEKKKEDIVDSNQGGGRVSLFVFVALKLFRLLVPHMMLLYLDFLKDGQNTSGVMFYLEVCFPNTKRI